MNVGASTIGTICFRKRIIIIDIADDGAQAGFEPGSHGQ